MIQPIGYFKLHRELYHKPIWKQSTPEQKVVLMTLLAMAWFNPNEWEWKGQKFKTEPGQFITSLDSIVLDCGKGISTKNVRTALKRFENLGFLANESTKTGRLITIANWDLYQEHTEEVAKQSAKGWQRGGKEVASKEERKKERTKNIVDFFEKCWAKYPKKEGKGKISLAKKTSLYNLGSEFEDCIDRYIDAKSDTDKKFLQMGSTFFNSGYEDYLNSNYKQDSKYTPPQYNMPSKEEIDSVEY